MKRSFITGIIILLPIVVTFFLFSLILDIFTAPFLDIVTSFLIKYKNIFIFPISAKILSFIAKIIILILFCFVILLLGMLGRWFIFKTLLSWGNTFLMKIPFFKGIYHTIKDLINSVISIDERKAFIHPLLVNFPSKKSFSVSFLSGTVPKQCEEVLNKKLTPVFMPTAPHPISGYLLFAEEELVKKIDMTNEEAIKFIISCGVVTPEEGKENPL